MNRTTLSLFTTLGLATLGITALGCGAKNTGSRDSNPPTPAPLEVSWDRTISLTDLLPAGDETGMGPITAVGIAPRNRSAEGVRDEASPDPAFEVRTRCGERHCLDAIIATSADSLPLTDPSASDDEKTILGSGDGSWVERGIKITQVGDTRVSFLEGRASMSEGAAHSVGEIVCRTHSRKRSVTAPAAALTVADIVGEKNGVLVVAAVESFLERERENGELRADHLRDLEPRNVLIGAAPNELLYCVESAVEASGGTVELIRVRLPAT